MEDESRYDDWYSQTPIRFKCKKSPKTEVLEDQLGVIRFKPKVLKDFFCTIQIHKIAKIIEI